MSEATSSETPSKTPPDEASPSSKTPPNETPPSCEIPPSGEIPPVVLPVKGCRFCREDQSDTSCGYSRCTAEIDVTLGNTKPEVGWAWVSKELYGKDDAEMKNYSEDIDTLLIVDGLFSAVVSAFIVLAVTLLRPDKAEAAVTLLSNISTQLSSLKITPPFINSTAQDMATTDPSDKLASARGFNILWFFGLLLSLTSAILGILAKQWIREYLQWKQPTATPRDNVLVRQIRRESWDGLYAASIISLVPFLLEIAIIFFLGGTFAFLNSILIDRVVQIIVSVVIAASLALIIVVIILPIYYQRSPYRSPTMLVILVLATWLSRTSTPSDETPPAPALPPTPAPLLTPLQHAAPPNDVPLPITFDDHFKRQHTTNYNHLKENLIWRFNDLTGADLARGKLRHQSRGQAGEGQSKNRGGTIGAACSVLLEELKLELEGDSGIDNMKTYLNNLPPNSDVVGTYTTALGESDLLFRALVLLVADSNTPDGAILRQLPYCVETIFPSLNCLELFSPLKVEGTRDSEMVIGGGFQSLSIWYMLSRVRATGAGHMGSFVDHPLCQNYSIAEYVLLLLRDKISRNGVPEEAHGAPDDPHGAPGDPHDALEDPNYMTFLGPEQDRLRTIYEVTERRLAEAQLIVISYVFACGLRARVEEALYYCTRLKSNTNPVVAVLERRMRELLYAMIFTTFRWDIGTRLWRLCLQDCAEILARAFNAVAVHKHKKDFEALFPELQHLVLEVLSDRFPVHFGPRRRLHVMSLLPGEELEKPWRSLIEQFSKLIVDERNPSSLTQADLDILAQLVDRIYEDNKDAELSEQVVDAWNRLETCVGKWKVTPPNADVQEN